MPLLFLCVICFFRRTPQGSHPLDIRRISKFILAAALVEYFHDRKGIGNGHERIFRFSRAHVLAEGVELEAVAALARKFAHTFSRIHARLDGRIEFGEFDLSFASDNLREYAVRSVEGADDLAPRIVIPERYRLFGIDAALGFHAAVDRAGRAEQHPAEGNAITSEI